MLAVPYKFIHLKAVEKTFQLFCLASPFIFLKYFNFALVFLVFQMCHIFEAKVLSVSKSAHLISCARTT